MAWEKNRRRAFISGASMALLVALCCVLALLQYRWIGEISRAEGERLQNGLQASLQRLSHEFNSELSAACFALLPTAASIEKEGREQAYQNRYLQWREAGHPTRLFRQVGVAVPKEGALELLLLNFADGSLAPAAWPDSWQAMHAHLSEKLSPDRKGHAEPYHGLAPVIDIPRFGERGQPPPAPGIREQEWLLVELDVDYVREQLLPELLQRHLGAGGRLDYEAVIVDRWQPQAVIFATQGRREPTQKADATATLFEIQYDRFLRRGPGAREGGKKPPGPAGLDSGRGRWLLSVHHRAGSLEAVVARARWRNLGVSAVLILLILATAVALVRFTRRAQDLADMQMDFVAGVSHELRTPLTVMRTAAYNLRGRVASNPAQVERYGALIQQECEKLTAIVEQILRYASHAAGSVIRERQPLSLEALIDEELNSKQEIFETARCVVERKIQPGLPLVLGDAMALRHALENLISNAVKYGAEGGNWIGIFASAIDTASGPAVEIRVADRGPGIPREEQRRIFDAFFRGKRAVRDQVHGTGLGLNLVKRIVEAHGGTIAVQSEPMRGTEFIVRLPAAPAERQDEFAHSFN